jgi:hypothetical protein
MIVLYGLKRFGKHEDVKKRLSAIGSELSAE